MQIVRSGHLLNLITVLGACCLLPGPAYAVDGVIEINQARAMEGGVTASDTPGFPITIDAPGSYVLTGDLQAPSISVVGIDVEADRVTIDLNGHSMDGRAVCTGEGENVNCAPSNNADGINSLGFSRTTVQDGRIVGFARGVILGPASQVVNVDSSRNANGGVDVGSGSEVRNCRVFANGGPGRGILAGQGSTVAGNSVRGNEADGILAAEGVLVESNSVTENGEDGIEGFSGVMVTGNTVRNNGNQAGSAFQLRLNSDAAYIINTIVSSGTNGTVSGGVNLAGNACNGSASCP